MILLVSGSLITLQRYLDTRWSRFLGQLNSPRAGNTTIPGVPWALDNGAFSGFDSTMYRAMLKRHELDPLCRFVTTPDVVADHRATLALWREWAGEVSAQGWPLAFVLQDGCTPDSVPWDECSAVFVGGTTEYKLGQVAAECVREAKRRGLWAHMGRVNSVRRLQYAHSIGCDSVDGSSMSRFCRTHLPLFLRACVTLDAQGELWPR